jgi:CheY-specific phosphatase CheX
MTDQEKIREKAVYSLLAAMESAAFLFADEGVENAAEEKEILSWIGWKVGFSGPASGQLELYMPENLGAKVAGNMLGIEADKIDHAVVVDAVGELLNIACGHFLTDYYGENPVFNLTMPATFDRAGFRLREKIADVNWVWLEGEACAMRVEISWSVYS